MDWTWCWESDFFRQYEKEIVLKMYKTSSFVWYQSCYSGTCSSGVVEHFHNFLFGPLYYQYLHGIAYMGKLMRDSHFISKTIFPKIWPYSTTYFPNVVKKYMPLQKIPRFFYYYYFWISEAEMQTRCSQYQSSFSFSSINPIIKKPWLFCKQFWWIFGNFGHYMYVTVVIQ